VVESLLQLGAGVADDKVIYAYVPEMIRNLNEDQIYPMFLPTCAGSSNNRIMFTSRQACCDQGS